MNNIKESWCNFVLNEGIMPAGLVRKLKESQKNNDELCSIIADILINRENSNFDTLYNFPEKNSIRAAFNTDMELLKWLDSVTDLLFVIKTFANKGANFANMVNEACVSFIKICPLVADERKNLYIDAPSAPTPIINLGSDPKQAFKNYLERCGYSFNTINSYISSINMVGKLSCIQRDLWSIIDGDEMNLLFHNLETNPDHHYDEFKQKDFDNKKIPSNALKRYIEFLFSKDTNKINLSPNSAKGKIGDLVQSTFKNILQSGKIPEHEIKQLMNMEYCKQIFRTRGNQFPILAMEERDRARYYKTPIQINGKIYYISSQWYEEQLPYLKTWLSSHGALF